MTEVLRTPDFDHYNCNESILSATLESSTALILTWSDGRIDQHHPWTLRENATDASTTAAVTRERLTDIATWGDDIEPRDIDVGRHGLEITWAPDGLVADYDVGWLRNLGSQDWHPEAIRPATETWDSACHEPPTFDGPRFLFDDAVLGEALRTLGSHGLIRLVDLPDGHDIVLEVGSRIGVVRPTHFGPDFDVTVRHDADSQAYTGARLAPHTDIPTREVPVGLQLLHCRVNTVSGGESLMVDGLAVAEHLRTIEPQTFDALCSLSWVWANRSNDVDVRWSAPVIGMKDDRIDEIRSANTLRLFPDMAAADVDRAYRAIRQFARLCDAPEFRIMFPFRAGDCVVFDNRRVLHGREAFDLGHGERILRGCYVDRDDLYSRLRILARDSRQAQA